MATISTNYGTETAFGLVSNMASLANNAAKPLGVVDNSSNKAVDAKIHFEITLAAASVSATGSIELYLIESTESTSSDFTDGLNPDGTADIASSLKNAILIQILAANVNGQVVRAIFDLTGDLAGRVRVCPKYWTLVALNKTGAAFAASTHEVNYTPIKMDVA